MQICFQSPLLPSDHHDGGLQGVMIAPPLFPVNAVGEAAVVPPEVQAVKVRLVAR